MFQRRYNVVTQPRRRHAIASKPCDPQPRFDSRRRYVIWKCSSFPFGGFSLGSLRKTTNTNLRAYVRLSYILVSQFWSETDHLMTCFAAWLILTHHPSHLPKVCSPSPVRWVFFWFTAQNHKHQPPCLCSVELYISFTILIRNRPLNDMFCSLTDIDASSITWSCCDLPKVCSPSWLSIRMTHVDSCQLLNQSTSCHLPVVW